MQEKMLQNCEWFRLLFGSFGNPNDIDVLEHHDRSDTFIVKVLSKLSLRE